jgi:hypothetical protein
MTHQDEDRNGDNWMLLRANQRRTQQRPGRTTPDVLPWNLKAVKVLTMS